MDVETVIQNLSEIRSQIHKSGAWKRPQVLSEIALKIGTYLTYLGEHLPILEAEYLDKRSSEYKKNISSGKSASASENEARYSTTQERIAYEKVKQFHKDFQQLISIIQSHLRILNEQERNNL